MKKILFTFVLAMLAFMGVSAQTTINVTPDSTGTVEIYPSIENITYDTVMDSTYTYVYDFDSIVAIDSMFSPHHEFIGLDTTYLCTDTLLEVIPIIVEDTTFSEHYIDLHAVAQDDWVFDRWVVISTTNDSVPVVDTIVIYDVDIDAGDTVFMEGWLEFIPWIDTTWDSGLTSIDITAYFVQDTNTTAIRDITGSVEFTIYPNPTSGTITILGDIRSITVMDINGRIVTSTTTKQVIDLTNQPTGIYIIRVTDIAGNMGTSKIIKK
jgi:hypothetical protein